MNPVDEIQEINVSFKELLKAPEKAEIPPFHETDDLMVWFLLGGKDVGKSTFLNSLLEAEVSRDHPDSAEGTNRFVAYIHRSSRSELEERLKGLPLDVHFHTHESELHRRLCLIDSPDFDSRFLHHTGQVLQVLQSGVSDGAVLLASPEKYKNRQYWEAFGQLSRNLSPRHLLFVLTKADELGDYMDEVRADFGHTIGLRLQATDAGGSGALSDPDDSRIFLINSLDRSLDFARLESRLMRRLSSYDVRTAHKENVRHTVARGVKQIQEHYRLEEIGRELREAMATERINGVCEEHFPESYFHAISVRLAANREIANTIRERLWTRPEGTLAGTSAIMAALQWLSSLNPFRIGSLKPDPGAPSQHPPLDHLLRWGQEPLEERLFLAQKEAFYGLNLERLKPEEPNPTDFALVMRDLHQILEDLLLQPPRNMLSWPIRLSLNLPVYLYLVFFIFLLLSPIFPLLRAGNMFSVPELAGALTLESVKVAVIGFLGYYTMVVLYLIRKQRDRVRLETQTLSRSFVAEMRPVLRNEVLRPLDRFASAFSRLEERLDMAAVPD